MSAHRVPRLLRTLWYLRPEQVAGQLARALGRRPHPLAHRGPAPGLRLGSPAVPYLPAPAHAAWDGALSVRLLNREVHFEGAIAWDHAEEGPLFAYHLHQLDWARPPHGSAEVRRRVLEHWIAHHRAGIGWDAGPISLRTFAWLKLLTTPGALPDEAPKREPLLASLAAQLTTLARWPERHLLANHYLWNLLALVFAGAALSGADADRWLAHEARLRDELAEQLLADGAHYERSPMYHGLLLESVLDLLNVHAAAPGRLSEGFASELRDAAARMLGALEVWTHPDGEIALFGDSAFGIAHPPAALRGYAHALGVAPRAPTPAGALPAGGFVRLAAGPFVLIATAAPPSPPYQPGHAHCDALSFELSVAGERVVTDTGVFEYRPGPLRDLARATRSHATVEIDGREQAEIWAAHRIGGRPDVGMPRVDPPKRAEAVCAGWATPEVLHRRIFEVESDAVTLRDRFDLPAPRARLVLPLAPGLEPALEGSAARLALRGGRTLVLELPAAARFRVAAAPYFPEFGKRVERLALVGEAESLAEATWRIRLA